MRHWILLLAVAALLAGRQTISGQSARISAVDPLTAKVGDLVTATGEGIDKTKIDALYLTDGTNDFKVQVMEQSDTEIKFKVPKTKPGRYSLMVRTKETPPKLLEQPVKIDVE
jgi:hypothetical protein